MSFGLGTTNNDRMVWSSYANYLSFRTNFFLGLEGNDLIYGGAYQDAIYGGPGADQMFGGDGNDVFVGPFDAGDVVSGGDGVDQIRLGDSASPPDPNPPAINLDLSAFFTAMKNGLSYKLGGATFSSIEAVDVNFTDRADYLKLGYDYAYLGTGYFLLEGGNDSFYGGSASDLVYGGSGNDRIYGQRGQDYLYGDLDDDTLSGGVDNDKLYGGAGNDTLYGGSGRDYMEGGVGDDVYSVDNEFDVVVEKANEGRDLVVTHNYNVVLSDNVENLLILAEFGRHGTGNALDNKITGGIGADTLRGMTGNDILIGGEGDDSLYGGAGADTFQYRTIADAANSDHIRDFNAAEGDLIDLSILDAKPVGNGNNRFDWLGTSAFTQHEGELRYIQLGTGVLVQGDVDGDGRSDFTIMIADTHGIDAGAFLL